MKIALSQINPVIGDIDYNFDLIAKSYQDALENSAQIVVFPELAITGYSPCDLLQKKYFIADVFAKIQEICALTKGQESAILLGAPIFEDGKIFNCALFIHRGEIVKKFYKKNLPNYGVFDEKRYFSAGKNVDFVDFGGKKIAVLICEDIWHEENADEIKQKNCDLTIVLNASPYHQGKFEERMNIARNFAINSQTQMVYVNQVGGFDSLIFDGRSFVMNKNGELNLILKDFAPDFKIHQLNNVQLVDYQENLNADIYNALTSGLKDYVFKTGFQKVLLGMSGGVDSALVATIAVDALGAKNVRLVALPSKFNSKQSFDDAFECAKNLGVKLEIIEIENAFNALNETLAPAFEGRKQDLTEENMQSRIRGLILMALSNKFGGLLLSTGNKSELAVGYATIYGDMCGAYNPLKDVYKTEVYKLCKWRNLQGEVIPNSILTKAPTAELRFNQKDSDSLPDYEILDKILYQIIEEEKSVAKIVDFDVNLVKKIAQLFYKSEYKRKQAVLGPQVSKMSFDLERRYVISNRYFK